MTPELGEVRRMEQLAASDTPSREGAWWIMLQTAESICNCASLRDPVNNTFLSEFWTDATKYVVPLLESKAERPLPYDDFMQLVSYCGNQLQKIVNNPRHNIVKVDKMVMPYRVKNTGSRTMNWLGKQPGKTINEKLAGKNKMLTQVNEYSYDIRENQVSMMLYHQIMQRVSDLVNYGINVNGYDDTDSVQMAQLQKIKKQLRNSPLAEVRPKNHNQANNALLSDKNYSVVWRAYRNMAKFDTRMAEQWEKALEMYVKAVFLAINAELLSYEEVYVMEDRIKLDGLHKLRATYVVGCHLQRPYVVELTYNERNILLSMYDATFNGLEQQESEMRMKLTFTENCAENLLGARHGVPIDVTIEGKKKAEIILFADLSGIKSINLLILYKIFSFGGLEQQKRRQETGYVEGSVAFDIIANGNYLRIEDTENPMIPVFGSRNAVSYVDKHGNISVFPSGSRGIHGKANEIIMVNDAVMNQNSEGLRIVLEEIHNTLILNRDDYFFYLVPDALEEILQKNLKQCVKSWFSKTFPVWRSVAALTDLLNNPEYSFAENSIFAYIDFLGDTATTGMMTIHAEKAVLGYVCNHFPPFPQIQEGDDITEDAYCKDYVCAYAGKYGLSIPEDVVSKLVRFGKVHTLMRGGSCANQFIECKCKTVVYQITYDEELVCRCIDRWLSKIQKFWKTIHVQFDASKMPNQVIFLSDILSSVLSRLKRENVLYRIFPKAERKKLSLYQSASDQILRGALIYKNRLNRQLPTWTEYLPHLSLEVIKDGDYAELELIGNDVSFDVMGDDNEHIVEEKLVLKANEKEFSFPLIKQDISRKSTMIDAYITDKSFPLDHDVVAALFVKYRYGFDNSYELTLRPVHEKETAFKEIVVEWTNTDCKSNSRNIWPPETNRFPDDKVLKTIERTRKDLLRIQSSIKKHIVNYKSHMDKSYQIQQTSQHLFRNIFNLRNIVLSDLPEAKEFMKWFISTPLYKYIGQIAGMFKHQDIPENFFDDHKGMQLNYFIENCHQAMFSIGCYTPQEIQDSYLKQYHNFNDRSRIKVMIGMLLQNGNNRSAIRLIMDDIRNTGVQNQYMVKMHFFVQEFGRMCCFDSNLVYDFYDVDPSFMDSMIKYIMKSIKTMLNQCEKEGDSYFPKPRDAKTYVSYMVALLSLLRLRDPERAKGFTLLAVGSDKSKKLAREIRVLDGYMSRECPIRSTIRFNLHKPKSLSKMSDLSYALDLYLNGDKRAAFIEVAGVEEED